MKTFTKMFAVTLIAGFAVFGVTACTEPTEQDKVSSQVNAKAEGRAAYTPTNDVEFNNYNEAQKIYDDPNAIFWCTTSLPNDSSPLITVPIRGKLTSSSTSYFPGTLNKSNGNGNYIEDQRSVDGMFHGNPPPYRFGFTPAGVLVSFENLGAICQTQLTDFQREKTFISVEGTEASKAVNEAQKKAEALLKDGKTEEASKVLTDATSNYGTK